MSHFEKIRQEEKTRPLRDRLRRALWQVNYRRQGQRGVFDQNSKEPPLTMRESLLILRDAIEDKLAELNT